ncbi:MAG TPA: cupredoxin domain-containing protein [Candidatus Saccharimonadales bacterium]|nr:cupredoxin domain-containing protein [Candidatus Saccharimonadales bacterium]
MKRKYSFFCIAIVMILVAGVIVVIKEQKTPRTPSPVVKKQHTPLPKEVTILLDKNGFSPKEVTIRIGSAIRWKNISGDKQTVNSDDYPTNQLHRELNFGVFNDSSSVSYIFTKPGTYGYHNQFHHEQQGKIIVIQ